MKKKVVKNFFCLFIAMMLCFGDTVSLFGRAAFDATAESAASATSDSGVTDTSPEQTEGVIRPESIDEGLSVNELEDIRGRRVTVRQPVMEIIEKDITREPAKEMSNVYEMLDFETGEPIHKLAQINFASDPSRQAGNKDHPMYPMRDLARSDKDEDGNVSHQKYFSEFTKYMLLRQAYYFNTHVTDIIKENKLMKHPAADYIYGKIPDEAKAVTMRIVTDPIYRSPMTTGLYLAPGELVTVKIKNLKEGETVSLYTHHQDTMGYLGYREDGSGFGRMEDYLEYWDDIILKEAQRAEKENDEPDFEKYKYGLHGQWQWQNQKVPCMGTTFNIVGTGKETEVKIGSMYGGPLYIKPTNDSVEMEISGAVLTPHFVLGVTSVEEFDRQLREAPGLIATLDVENGQLIGPAEDMRKCDDIEKLAYFWHSVFAIDISLNGREYNYNMTMCYDLHVPAGEAVALNSNFCAQPEYWFPICMNYEKLTTEGNWGTFHELGHVQAKTHGVNWGFCDGDGEVWNNTLILLIYSMLCNMDTRLTRVEHGEYVHPFTAIERSQNITQKYKDKATGDLVDITDYGQINNGDGAHFDQLSMYATLLHSFGSDKFVDMFYTYKMNPAYCENKRADFVYRIGVVDRVNILDWVNNNYFARITNDMFTPSQLEFLNNLPKFVPVAYRWANGMDGHETARRYDVNGKNPTVFDLGESEFTSPGKVEIIDVNNVVYGQINYDKTGRKVTYTPPEDVTEYDSFDIIVKTEGGRRVTLNVNMHLVYRGLYGEVWDLGNPSKKPSVDEAIESVKGRDYDYTVTSPSAGVQFTHTNMEYLHLQLKYRAPKGGAYEFYVKADDVAKVYFYKGDIKNNNRIGNINVDHDTQDFTRYGKVSATLNLHETVYIDCHLVNWGGLGHITVGVRAPGSDEIVALPADQILTAEVSDSELATVDSFKGWQPRFTDSIKDTTIDYKNSTEGWSVISAPENEPGCNKEYLVDGNESTIYHSKYSTGKVDLPHVFVIDTGEDQIFNYFEFLRRTNGNDKLLEFELYSCTSAEYNDSIGQGADTTGWTWLFEGYSTNVNAARQRMSFARTEIRYFKFIVKSNNAGLTVLKELYAGIETKLNQTVKPAKFMKNMEGFDENPANGKLSADKTGATFEFEFLGNGFDLFADTAPDYGTATITIDDGKQDIIDLCDKTLFNKQVYTSGELETAVHKVKIVTNDDKPFNISFINVKYGTPVSADEYPALKDKEGKDDYGNTDVARQFTREWKTLVKDYKTLTSIKFTTTVPADYKDTYVRIDTYIRLYRKDDKIAFVYPGKILAPIECGSLFSGCENLEEIDLANFDTAYMRGAMSMFYGCKALTSIDVTKFSTENVLSFGKMFGGCEKLKNLNLSVFVLDENANVNQMFENCTDLEQITLPEKLSPAVARRSSSATQISCELPYVYHDEQADKYITELVFDANTAGHILKIHKNHILNESHERIEPKCEDEGIVAYKVCATCKCKFDATDGTTLYRDRDIVIPALGHDYYYEWPVDPSAYPTCAKPGQGGQYKCSQCQNVLESIGSSSALGHTFEVKSRTVEFIKREELVKTDVIGESGEYEYTKEELVVKGIAKVTFILECCSYSDWEAYTKCGYETEVVIEIECDTHTEANCTEDESFFYDFNITQEILLKAIAEQDKEDDVADHITGFNNLSVCETTLGDSHTGHKMEKVDEIPATCLYSGSTAGMRCSVCGLTDGIESIEPHGHNMVETPAVQPTCTTPGHGAGKVCSYCGEEGEGVKHIEPLGHEFTVPVEAEAPTCTKVGHTAGLKCSRCDAVEGCEIIEDLGHTPGEWIVDSEPTDKKEGHKHKECTVCGETLEEATIEKLALTVGCSGCGGAVDGDRAMMFTVMLVALAVISVRKKQ